MRKSSLCILAGIALFVAGEYGCKKVNGINNNEVIQTPFSLYFADTAGAVYSSNNGKDISHVVFRSDGKPTRSIIVSGNNVLFAKTNLYISTSNGANFNHSLDSLVQLPSKGCNGLFDSINLNQSMIIDPPTWNRLYTVSNTTYGPAASNYLGLIFNDDNGIPGHWHFDGTYDTAAPGHPADMGILPIAATSLTQMANGVLVSLALSVNPGSTNPALGLQADTEIVRVIWAVNNAGWVRWHENTANPDPTTYPGIGGAIRTGVPLPSRINHKVPGYFTLGHINNRLIAIDHRCIYGAFYSDDTGRNWIQYSGLPANTGMLCIGSPFESVCLIGTDGKGLYVLNTHTGAWEVNNKGLGTNLVVRSITAKQNVYKNGTVQKFIFIATNQGIYQSTDEGLNWTKTVVGNFVSVY